MHLGGVFCGFSYRLRGLAAGASLSLVLSLAGLVCWDNKVLVWEFLVQPSSSRCLFDLVASSGVGHGCWIGI